MKKTKRPIRGSIHLVGTGPGDASSLTYGALDAIRNADEVWMQSLGPLNFEMPFLRPHLVGKKVVNLNDFYELPNVDRQDFYDLIEQRMLHLANKGRRITFLLPGNPLIWVHLTARIKQYATAGTFDLRITPGLSFLDMIWVHAPIDVRQFQLRLGRLTNPDVSTELDCVIGQVGDGGGTGSGLGNTGLFTSGLSRFCADAARLYPATHRVFISGHRQVHGSGEAVYRETTIAKLSEILPLFESTQYCVIIPGVRAQQPG
jgi:hypothetical protein